MECETGRHSDMQRVRRAKALEIEMLLTFEQTVAPHHHPCARHNGVLLHRIKMMGTIVPFIPQLLSMGVGFLMAIATVHFFNVDLVP
jgi:hypothetical protein